MKQSKPEKQGFTLIEIMVSTLALAIICLGCASSLSYGGGMIQRSQVRRAALTVAAAVMEDNIHNIGLAQLEQEAQNSGDNVVLSETIPIAGTRYIASTRVTNLTEDGDDVVLIDVVVGAPTIDPVYLSYKGLTD